MAIKLTPGDKHIIHSIVGRLHVSEPDLEVIAYVTSRMTPETTPDALLVVLREVVAQHHRNQDLYRSVMRGSY